MKPLEQYFHMVLFIQSAVLTFESVDEILWCYYSNENSLVENWHGVILLKRFGIFVNLFPLETIRNERIGLKHFLITENTQQRRYQKNLNNKRKLTLLMDWPRIVPAADPTRL